MADLMRLVEEVAFHNWTSASRLAAGQGAHRGCHAPAARRRLGSVREMVSRLLKGFSEQGLVALGREQIEIRGGRPAAIAEAV